MSPELPRELRYLPLGGVMSFLLLTMILFFMGPFDWPMHNYEVLSLFLFCVSFAIVCGYSLGVSAPARVGPLPYWRRLFILGAICSCVMIFPSAYVYTGKWPWEAVLTLFDQGQAYREFQARLQELDGQRGPIVLARTLTHWVSYAVIPIAVFRWRDLDLTMRLLLVGTIVSATIFSLLRGTDQGTFDIGFLIAMSVLVAVARECMKAGRSFGSFFKTKVGVFVAVAAVLFVALAFTAFIDRKTQRYDGNITDLCIGEDQHICINSNKGLAVGLGEVGRFALGIVTTYTSNGYYGLALSLEREFDSTMGIGHSIALTRIYEAATDDKKLYENSFTYRLRADGWSDLYVWSTMYTWIANDVGFPMTVVIVGLLAWLWGSSWRDAVRGDNDAAGIVFCMLTQTFMYSPANFQLALGTDTYAALLIWLGLWYYSARQAHLDA
jgi:hypothetical protein